MVQALRLAGAMRVLTTLWPVDGNQARDFMQAFYDRWLGQEESDPATALAATKLLYQTHTNPQLRNPIVWGGLCSHRRVKREGHEETTVRLPVIPLSETNYAFACGASSREGSLTAISAERSSGSEKLRDR